MHETWNQKSLSDYYINNRTYVPEEIVVAIRTLYEANTNCVHKWVLLKKRIKYIKNCGSENNMNYT